MAANVPETDALSGFPGSSFKYTPLRHVRVVFLRFCQGLFWQAPPGSYHWNEDDQKTEIYISSENKIDPDMINMRPGLHFTRGPVQFYSLGIDDLVSYDMQLDQKEKGVLVPGTMTINCVSRNDQETEDLAWIVAEHLWLLRGLLMKAGFFEIGRQPQIGSPSPAGSIVANDMGEEFYATPVTIPWQFARNSKLTPLGKKIVRSIEMSLSVRDPQKVQSGGAAHHPFEYPVNIKQCPPPPFAPSATDARGGTPDPANQRVSHLQKQRHPLDPSLTVSVRTVRPFRRAQALPQPGDAVPITNSCVEES